MNKILQILIGLLIFIIPIYVWAINYLGFGTAAIELVKGGLIWIALFIGGIILLTGILGLRED
jgi:hypothetical protein|tara:strand:+ start:465 stop:653 length:189 start_codon:yes stop_codon:yes gene_type:complete